MRLTLTALPLLAFLAVLRPTAADPPRPDPAPLEQRFRDTVQPFLQKHCLNCHGAEKPKGGLDLTTFASVEAVAKDHRRRDAVLEQLRAGAMPPLKAEHQPTGDERKAVLDWLGDVRRFEAARTAGDPGPVPPRRLSNAEYDYTVRDLTGVDLRPTKEFPVDPANEAGFDNSAESLAMSPDLLKKYLEAARRVADHLVLLPDGLTFADHPVISDTDRDKYAVRRIIDFYKRQPTELADYFFATWRYRHRAGNITLAQVAAEQKVSARYLALVWETLTEKPEEVGPIAALQAMWKELPDAGQADAARIGCGRMRDFVVKVRGQLVPKVPNLTAPGVHNGSQTMVMWKNRQFVANRQRYKGGALTLKDAGLPPGSAAAKAMAAPADKDAAAVFEFTFHRFCDTFPDAFYVSERARVYLDPEKEKKLGGRLLSAGFHSMTGYFRDDAPLYDLVLDRDGRRELDRLWRAFDFVTGAPMRQHAGFLWFERADSSWMRDPEFDPFRPEDKDCTTEVKITALSKVYIEKAKRRGAGETALEAMRVHFETINAAVRAVERDRAAAEPKHVAEVQAFAERAYRRPLTAAERDGVAAFYRALRTDEGLDHEAAIRDTLVRVLMSPHFCYRVDTAVPGNGVQPLTDHALASRLSYFLWSSTPDAELLAKAAAGELNKPDVLAAEARRMLADPKARGLATEFAGNWLDFRRFAEHNAVDRGRFPTFTDELRLAMFEEPVRFFEDVIRTDRPVLDLLYGKHTFVNPVLARHYGMPEPKSGGWERVDDADRHGRGGLLPMAVFLTRNSPGLRTSPVKRGYWVVRRLLGETIPAPPSEVPELPADEAKAERSLRETLAKHREHASCAGCHQRFDAVGLVFEGFGPVGERRAKDLGGRPVDAAATFPDGSSGTGIDGLRAYIRARRQADFEDTLCRKLLAYALGRSLLPGDDGTIEAMRAKLATGGHRFGPLVEVIVTSPQFRYKRVSGDPQPGSGP
jgi:mono/diheme cytochrome c family protein